MLQVRLTSASTCFTFTGDTILDDNPTFGEIL